MSAWLEVMLAAAFVAGAMGGVHCAAMCGGLVGAACQVTQGAGGTRWRHALAYNGGRILSYAIAGVIAGAAGQAGLLLRGDVVAQQVLLFVASLALIVLSLQLAGVAYVTRAAEAAGAFIWRRIQPLSGRFLPVRSTPHAFGIGMVWGWLPCGMVYAALLPALATGSPWGGALVMLAFGLGTLPNLLVLALFFDRAQRWRAHGALRVTASLAIATFGALGMLKVIHPAAFAPDGLICQVAPGLSTLFH